MGRVVDLRQRLEVEVGVDLRGRDAGVAEHFLHRAQVLRGLQQVAGERVAQHVRMHASARPRRRAQARRRAPTTAARSACPAADEQGFFIRRGKLISRGEPALERFRAFARPALCASSPLAGDRHLALPQVEPAVVDVERDELAQAQPEEYSSSNIAASRSSSGVAGFSSRNRRCAPRPTVPSERPRRPGARMPSAGVDAKAAVPHQPAKAAAPRGERQRERARTRPLA